GLHAALAEIFSTNCTIEPIRHGPKKLSADNRTKLAVAAKMRREKPGGAFVLDRKDEGRHIKYPDTFDPEGRMLHGNVVPQVDLGVGGTKFPLRHSIRTGGDAPALDCQLARLQPFDALTREVIDLGGFPCGVVEHPTVGVEIKLDPGRLEIIIGCHEPDMPPGCPSIAVRMQFKLVGEETLVAVGDSHIPCSHYTLRRLEILQRFRLQNDPLPLLWGIRWAWLRLGCRTARGLVGVRRGIERRDASLAH